jgi:hypothetical protein
VIPDDLAPCPLRHGARRVAPVGAEYELALLPELLVQLRRPRRLASVVDEP